MKFRLPHLEVAAASYLEDIGVCRDHDLVHRPGDAATLDGEVAECRVLEESDDIN